MIVIEQLCFSRKLGTTELNYVQMNFEATNRPQIVAKPKLAKPVPSSADVYAAIDHTMVLPSRGNKKPRKWSKLDDLDQHFQVHSSVFTYYYSGRASLVHVVKYVIA